MAEPYFIWNGKDSREMGVIVTQIPPVVYPAERVTEAKILGRSGSVLLSEGLEVYESYYKTIGVANRRAVDHREIAAWLRGSGTLVLSTEPNFVYDARIVKEAQASRVFRNNYEGSVAFLVQPLKAEYPAQPAYTLGEEASGSYTLTGRGDVPARPVYTLEGAGDMQLTVGDTSAGGSLIQVVLPDDEDGCVIDTGAAMVTNLDGTVNLCSVTNLFYNGFRGLWLPPGASVTISWNENVTGATMDARWRWL